MNDLFYYGKKLTLFNVAKYILGYDKLTEDVHKKWCDDLEDAVVNKHRVMFLKPRGTYKSTIYTVAFPIWLLMRDWVEHNGKFTLRILMTSSTQELATQFKDEVCQHFETNEKLLGFFGYNPVNTNNVEILKLKPRTIHKEPNIKAKGAGSAATSEHYDIIIADDIVNVEDRESKATRDKNFRWFQDIVPILNPGGLLLIVGTRWHLDDVYGRIIDNNEKYTEKDKYYIEIESAVDDKGTPLFPTILPDEELVRKRIEVGAVEFASQYMNNPLSPDTQIFVLEKMHLFTDYGPKDEMYKKCRTCGYLDPALGEEGDNIVFVVGTLMDNELLIREAIMDNATPITDFINLIYSYYIIYDIDMIYIETNGFQSLVANACRKKRLPISDVDNRKNKNVRIESSEPFFSTGVIKFREDWATHYEPFVTEIISYPVAKHDDAPDAMAGLAKAMLPMDLNLTEHISDCITAINLNQHMNSNSTQYAFSINPRVRNKNRKKKIRIFRRWH